MEKVYCQNCKLKTQNFTSKLAESKCFGKTKYVEGLWYAPSWKLYSIPLLTMSAANSQNDCPHYEKKITPKKDVISFLASFWFYVTAVTFILFAIYILIKG